MTPQLRPIKYKKPLTNHHGETWAYTDPQSGWFHQLHTVNGQVNAVVENEYGDIFVLPIDLIRFTTKPTTESEN